MQVSNRTHRGGKAARLSLTSSYNKLRAPLECTEGENAQTKCLITAITPPLRRFACSASQDKQNIKRDQIGRSTKCLETAGGEAHQGGISQGMESCCLMVNLPNARTPSEGPAVTSSWGFMNSSLKLEPGSESEWILWQT